MDAVDGYLLLDGSNRSSLLVHLPWVTRDGRDPVMVSWRQQGDCAANPIPSYRSSTLVFPPYHFTLDPVDLVSRFGKAFSLERRDELTARSPGDHLCSDSSYDLPRASCRVSYRWTFTFVPVERVEIERWRVEVRGSDRWSWGRTATVGGGVWVDWTHTTDLDVEAGDLTRVTGKVAIMKITPFSQPGGVFTVTHRSRTYPAYTPMAKKRGATVELKLWNDPGSMYRVDFTVSLVGPQALERLRAAGVPNPDDLYRDLAVGRPVDPTAIPLIPLNTRLVVKLAPDLYERQTDAFNQQLPCKKGATVKECFRMRGGESITVRRIG